MTIENCDIIGCKNKSFLEFSEWEYRITWRYCKKHYRHFQQIYEDLISE